MSSLSIDLDMTLLSSPVPPSSNVFVRGDYVGVGGADNNNNNNNYDDEQMNGGGYLNNGHTQFAAAANNGAVNTDSAGDSYNNNTFKPSIGGGGGGMMMTSSSENSSGCLGNTNNDMNEGKTAKRGMPTSASSNDNDSNIINSISSDENRLIIDGKPTQKYHDMTKVVESWREELYMMNVKNAIMLDDLVKLGADV